jgi:hypothetical protein
MQTMTKATDLFLAILKQRLTVQLHWSAAGAEKNALARFAKDASKDGVKGGAWICPMGETGIRPGQNMPAKAVVCIEHRRLSFETRVVKTSPALWLSDTMSVEGWLITPPTEFVQAEQRRVPRLAMSDSTGGTYGKLIGLKGGGQIGNSFDLGTRLWDLSATGASFVCMSGAGMNKLAGLMSAVQIYAGGVQVELPAKVIYSRALSSKTTRIGVELIRDADPMAAEKLDEVVLALAARKKVPMVLPWHGLKKELKKAG